MFFKRVFLLQSDSFKLLMKLKFWLILFLVVSVFSLFISVLLHQTYVGFWLTYFFEPDTGGPASLEYIRTEQSKPFYGVLFIYILTSFFLILLSFINSISFCILQKIDIKRTILKINDVKVLFKVIFIYILNCMLVFVPFLITYIFGYSDISFKISLFVFSLVLFIFMLTIILQFNHSEISLMNTYKGVVKGLILSIPELLSLFCVVYLILFILYLDISFGWVFFIVISGFVWVQINSYFVFKKTLETITSE
ncbi:MAG: hypothetical protein HRU38_09700 [Saccharospirillaceae bacterium]|nr:hypothetical protein [Pseudomonadales bacterium]NRB78926.1 hypothetical protein [Saccharospirillaceae bacterium]